MEDGGSSNQTRSNEGKSVFTILSHGVENIQKVKDFGDTLLKMESVDVKMVQLKRKLDVLKAKEKDINMELNYAESLSLKRRKNEVENWLGVVERIKREVRQKENEVEEAKVKWIPNFSLQGNLDRLTAEVEELCRQGEFSGGLTLEAQESRGFKFPTGKIVGKRFLEVQKMILESLRKNDVLSIGIHGMGGIGKTTLLKHINNELVQNWPGTSVYWVTVSQNFTVPKLQEDIARALKFKFSCADIVIRTAELADCLGRRKNSVLILDDVWEDIPLDEVGISPYVNGCKLVLTTRDSDVCRKMCKRQIRVLLLSDEESWELFKEKLENNMELTPHFEEVAKSLVKECAGLPLGIITMARSFKGVEDMFEWKNALENMRDSKSEHGHMETKVFQVLKYSYDMLKDANVQQCFLDCSLYPEDYEIKREDLINLFIDEGLIDGIRSRQAGLYRGHTILNKLVNACLLEETEARKCVKMHDLVRDMARQITRDSPRFLVGAGRGLESIPDEEYWKEDLVKVSFMCNNISDIRFGSPKCPTLSTLLLQNNFFILRISNDFFLYMRGLNVLNLSNTCILRLPDSVSELVNLSALLLRGCGVLEYVPSLAKLTALKKLDLYRSAVIPIPEGIEGLIKLRYLDLRFGPSGRCKDSKIRGTEFVQLEKLESLYCVFSNIDGFNTYIRSLRDKGPTYYEIQVGNVSFFLNFPDCSEFGNSVCLSRFFKWECDATDGRFPLLLPASIEGLLIESSTIRTSSLCDVISLENATNLRLCSIKNCRGIEHLFSYSSSSISPLQTIEKLHLRNVDDLHGLISGNPSISSAFPVHVIFSSLKHLILHFCEMIKRLLIHASLPNLETVSVSRCHSLVELISTTSSDEEEHSQNTSAIVTLPKLSTIAVTECPSLVELISTTSSDEEEENSQNTSAIVTLPKLSTLNLCWLPSLRSVPMVSDSLQMVVVQKCSNLKRIALLDREQCLPSLKHVIIDEETMESLEWVHPNAKDAIQSSNNIALHWKRWRI